MNDINNYTHVGKRTQSPVGREASSLAREKGVELGVGNQERCSEKKLSLNLVWRNVQAQSSKTGREFPGGLVIRTERFHCRRGSGFDSCWGTKIRQAVWRGQKIYINK